jgi:hypothetical protein
VSAVYSLSCAGSNGSTLQIDFRRIGDRFVQSIRRIGSDGSYLAAWDGVQKPEAELWPASPPIQELSLETIDGRDVLLGVGRAGKCHWSVSVETVEIDSAAAFRFDIACRCPEPPQWLGSTYQASPDAADQAGTASLLAVQAQEDTALTSNGPQQITIQPTVMPRSWPATVRWRYAILAREDTD